MKRVRGWDVRPSVELVSVVIPAYNAAATIEETLASVRAQTHRALEIIVVDDGSTDDTAAIARRHADEDPRIRVVSIPNGGVAVARNTGIAASRGAFVAPIDADDLWHPEKIARQMAVMRAGEDIGYVYTLDRKIDAQGRVLSNRGLGPFEGHVYLRMLLCNFVGNGSSLLIRRAAIEQVGGYEPDLHRRGAQGCEDYLLQLLIARSWKVGLVPEYLTGYRVMPGTMSRDVERMVRSRCVMLEHVACRIPETPPHLLAASEAMVRARLGVEMLRRLSPAMGAAELWRAVRLDAVAASRSAWLVGTGIVRGFVRRRLARQSDRSKPGRHFVELAPCQEVIAFSHILERRISALTKDEGAFFRSPPAAHLNLALASAAGALKLQALHPATMHDDATAPEARPVLSAV